MNPQIQARLAQLRTARNGASDFAQDVEQALGILEDAVNVAEVSDLVDMNDDVRVLVDLCRAFSNKAAPLLRRLAQARRA